MNVQISKFSKKTNQVASTVEVEELISKKYECNQNNYIIVDFGTATTFDVITGNIYLGGIIAPGVNTSLSTLIKSFILLSYFSTDSRSISIPSERISLVKTLKDSGIPASISKFPSTRFLYTLVLPLTSSDFTVNIS